MQAHSILIAHADQERVDALSEQLSVDVDELHTATTAQTAIAKLAEHAIDVVLLGHLARPATALRLLIDARAGQLHTTIHRGQPVITLGHTDNLSVLRAYEAGSDHHLADDVDPMVLRAVIATILRRTLASQRTSRELRAGALHIDTATRTARVGEQPIHLTRTEFALLRELASEPHRVVTKDQLMRTVWGHRDTGRTRTLDSHAYRLRHTLTQAGAHGYVRNVWGVGYQLLPEQH